MNLIRLQHYYALVYYGIALHFSYLFLNGLTTDAIPATLATVAYFGGDMIIQMMIDRRTGKKSLRTYVHHVIPIALLTQLRNDPGDLEIFGLLLLTEISSVFLTLKLFIHQKRLQTLNNIVFAISFIGVRTIYCNLRLLKMAPSYFALIGPMKFLVVGASLLGVATLNVGWTYLIVRKLAKKFGK